MKIQQPLRSVNCCTADRSSVVSDARDLTWLLPVVPFFKIWTVSSSTLNTRISIVSQINT